MLLIFFVMFLSGLFAFLTGIWCRKGLKLNGLVGVRTDKTMVDEETFVKANRATWRTHMFNGVILCLAAFASLIVKNETLLATILIGACVVVVGVVLYGGYKAHRAVDEHNSMVD